MGRKMFDEDFAFVERSEWTQERREGLYMLLAITERSFSSV